MTRAARRLVAFCLLAGVLPAAGGLGLAWTLSTRTTMSREAIMVAAAGLALVVLAGILLAAARGGRAIDALAAQAHAGEAGPDGAAEAGPWAEPEAMADDALEADLAVEPVPGRSPADEVDLGGLAEALAAERRAAPGPALRKLLRYARPPAHRPRAIGVNEAVNVCVGALQPLARQEGWSLGFDPDPNAGAARLDLDAFHELLLNLILNARDATGRSGSVDVRTQAMGRSVLVAVRDDGPGVPEADISRIFQPFVTTKKGAAGLGLALCRRIAQLHGGAIWATNVVPRGFEVAVRLPGHHG